VLSNGSSIKLLNPAREDGLAATNLHINTPSLITV